MNPRSATGGEADGPPKWAAWIVRADPKGEDIVRHNLTQGVVTLGYGNWVIDADEATLKDRDALHRYIEERFPDEELSRRQSGTSAIRSFCNEIEIGDLVVLPLKNYGPPEQYIAVGRVTGDAATDARKPKSARLRRNVEWLEKEVPKAAVKSDLQDSINSPGTLFKSRKPRAARRLLRLAENSALIGDEAGVLPEDSVEVPEGAKTRVEVNRYERDSGARKLCLKHYDYTCQVCGLKFDERYGDFARNYMHAHHKTPLSQITDHENHTVDPLTDLVAVCPNCHAMIHHHPDNPITVEQLRALMDKAPEATGGG